MLRRLKKMGRWHEITDGKTTGAAGPIAWCCCATHDRQCILVDSTDDYPEHDPVHVTIISASNGLDLVHGRYGR